jgi:hypothetical protein
MDIQVRLTAHRRCGVAARPHGTVCVAQYPYNVERVFYYLTNANTALVAEWMGAFASTGSVTLPAAAAEQLHSSLGLRACTYQCQCAALTATPLSSTM